MLSMTAPAGSLVKTTLVDFPGRVASAFFLSGCNLRCPYCYNKQLVENSSSENYVSIQQLFDHLEKRKNIISGLVISGGEALLSPYLETIIRTAKSKGYSIKLDTNGTFPEKLAGLIQNPETKPDYIAIDIKTSLEKYKMLTASNETFSQIADKLKKSISIISFYPQTDREFRTVLVPPLTSKDDIQKIASLLPEDASWYFAPFQNNSCLSPEYEKIQPYNDAETAALVKFAQSFIPNAKLR